MDRHVYPLRGLVSLACLGVRVVSEIDCYWDGVIACLGTGGLYIFLYYKGMGVLEEWGRYLVRPLGGRPGVGMGWFLIFSNFFPETVKT